MFSITLQAVPFECSGADALDLRRKLGLPDGTSFWFVTNGNQYGQKEINCPVGEGFARSWFNSNSSVSVVKVPVSLLIKGDLKLCTEHNDKAVTFADLSEERAKEIYIAVRFHACRDQVERLKKEKSELEERLESFEK